MEPLHGVVTSTHTQVQAHTLDRTHVQYPAPDSNLCLFVFRRIWRCWSHQQQIPGRASPDFEPTGERLFGAASGFCALSPAAVLYLAWPNYCRTLWQCQTEKTTTGLFQTGGFTTSTASAFDYHNLIWFFFFFFWQRKSWNISLRIRSPAAVKVNSGMPVKVWNYNLHTPPPPPFNLKPGHERMPQRTDSPYYH